MMQRDAQIAELEVALAEAEARIARLELEREAARVLGDDEQLELMDKPAIWRSVLARLDPVGLAAAHGKPEVYLEGRYDAAIAQVKRERAMARARAGGLN